MTSLMLFGAAVRTLNFTRAVKELDVSQAAVSKHIKSLENYSGFALFERHARGLRAASYCNHYTVLVAAAIGGHGVTLGTRYRLDRALESGRLARLPDFSVKSGRRYYLLLNNSLPFRDDDGLIHDCLRDGRVEDGC